MEDCLHEIEIQRALADADKVCSEQVPEMFDSIEKMAHEQNLEVHGHVQEAAKAYAASGYFGAIQLLKKAVLMCEQRCKNNLEYIVLKHELKDLINNIRDVLIIRIQRCVQMGQRQSFKNMLGAAHGGGRITDLDEWSQLMQSYQKKIRQMFPDQAFPSKTSRKKQRRPRKKKARCNIVKVLFQMLYRRTAATIHNCRTLFQSNE